jgi:DNA uptake protein ComE-like DNA-binding protein
MKFNSEPIRSWFGFSRRERRSSFILLLIIFIITALRIIVPVKNISIEDVTGSISDINDSLKYSGGRKQTNKHQFTSETGTASYGTLAKPVRYSIEKGTFNKDLKTGTKFKNTSDIRQNPGTSIQHNKPLLDINSCDSASLVRLPGIGPVLSARIIKYRHLLGGYSSVNQLTEVYGLSPETFDIIKGRLYADSIRVIKIDINTAGFKEIARLPYFEKYEVTAILKYRELKGRISGLSDLIDNKLITVEKADKVRPYLKYE